MVENIFMLITTCYEKIFEVKFKYGIPVYQLKFNIDSRNIDRRWRIKSMLYSTIYQLLKTTLVLYTQSPKNLFDRVPLTMCML